MLLCHCMGSGKTVTALACARELLLRGAVRRAVVLCPPTTTDQWYKTTVDLLGMQDMLDAGTLIIMHSIAGLRSIANGQPSLRGEDSLLIVDEAHAFRKRSISRGELRDWRKHSAQFLRACIDARRLLLLTGTPVVNDMGDVKNILHALDGMEFDAARDLYDEVFRVLGPYPTLDQLNLPCVRHMFAGKISFHGSSSSSAAAAAGYPAVEVHKVDVRMDRGYARLYDQVQSQPWMVGTHNEANVEIFRSGERRACNVLASLGKPEDAPKLGWLKRQLASVWAPHDKVLIYSNWIGSGVAPISALLGDMGIRHGIISGSTPEADRSAHIERFNRGETRVLLASGAGSEGMHLEGTRRVVILEEYWNPARISQTVARSARMGSHAHLPPQDRRVDVYRLLASKSNEDAERAACAAGGGGFTRGRGGSGSAGVTEDDRAAKQATADYSLSAMAACKQAWVDSVWSPFLRSLQE